jgi:hypothetical protein
MGYGSSPVTCVCTAGPSPSTTRCFTASGDRVADLGIPVFLNLTTLEPGIKPYLKELDAFDRWAQRYASLPVVLAHGLPLFRFMDGGDIRIPPSAWKPLSR